MLIKRFILVFALLLAVPPHSASAETTSVEKRQADLDRAVERARKLRQRAQTQARRGLNETALRTYERALKAYAKFPAALNEAGVILIKLGQLQRAIAMLRKALEYHPDMASAWANLAEAQRRAKRCDQAVVSYRKLIELKPEDGPAYYGMAACLIASDKKAEALWALERYLTVDPSGNFRAEVTRRAAGFIKAGVASTAPKAASDPKKAPKIAKKESEPKAKAAPPVAEPPPAPGEPGRLKSHRGDALFWSRRYMAALRSYVAELDEQESRTPAETANPGSAPKAGDKATAKRGKGSAKSAPSRPKVAPSKSKTTARKPKASPGKVAKKRATLPPKGRVTPPKSQRRGPVDVELVYKIGAVYAVMGEYRLALRWWRRALVLSPDRALIIRHIGLASRKLAAKKQLDLGSPEVNPNEAVEVARQALLDQRFGLALTLLEGLSDREAYYLRGEAALRLGFLEQARQNFAVIVEQAPNNQSALGGLAEALVRLKKTEQAQEPLSKWLGDRMALPEDFLVLRAMEANARIQAGPAADKAVDDDFDEDL